MSFVCLCLSINRLEAVGWPNLHRNIIQEMETSDSQQDLVQVGRQVIMDGKQ